jgi:hypothetical protein
LLFGLKTPAYADGGLVDYTGLAWVDGTKTRPESFLDAQDTSLLRGMLDAFNYVSVPLVHTPVIPYTGGSTTIGDVYVTINEAEFKDDADYEKAANRIGKEFTKVLTKNGLTLTGYAG